MTDTDARDELRASWTAFCDRLKALGDRMMEDDFPQGDLAAAEGFRHLARMTNLGLTLAYEYDDPDFPLFLRHNDDVTQWGGNNADNTYLYARVDPSSVYRVYGNARNTSGFIVTVRDGFMHMGHEKAEDLSSADMQIDEDGSFELVIGGEERPGNWMPMMSDAHQIGVRIYFDDWEHQRPPEFHIVRIGSETEAPALLTVERSVRAIEGAGEWIERNLLFWNEWLAFRMQFLPVNGISPPMEIPGGSNEVITYAGGRFQLAEDEALVLSISGLIADYIGLVYYTEGWFESGNMTSRTTSLNQNQIHVDDDGGRRIVVCGRDPGVMNWLDTEGRPSGVMAMRTVNGDVMPEVTSQVVAVTDLSDVLPTSTKWMNVEERAEQRRVRREHIANRFHR